ncbi:hypothetical protein A0J61_10430 [Choanephora cucurbitarum]|uniref:Uncharacterized protein n=1 Tax=Choanephora cucurbitarum TaxID=101091 RepID=A0A1C7MXN4_9FUNG|nr:hypothetical protein A0J61_10430 [Choanephora cucurbitarum]
MSECADAFDRMYPISDSRFILLENQLKEYFASRYLQKSWDSNIFAGLFLASLLASANASSWLRQYKEKTIITALVECVLGEYLDLPEVDPL